MGQRDLQWQGERKRWLRRERKVQHRGERVMARERDEPLEKGKPMTSYNKKER